MTTEYKEDPDSNIVELVIDGKVTKAEFDDIAAKMEAKIKKHGKIRLLKDIRHYGFIEFSALWDDIKFGFGHLKDIEKAAAVGDQKWLAFATKMTSPLLKCEVRHFDREHIEDARRWLRE